MSQETSWEFFSTEKRPCCCKLPCRHKTSFYHFSLKKTTLEKNRKIVSFNPEFNSLDRIHGRK